MAGPSPRPGIMSINPYQGGAFEGKGVQKVHKLSANETPLGPSPKAMQAYVNLASDLHRYPDGGSTHLRHALGEFHGLDPERLVVGCGSDELITLLIRSYAGPGDEVLYSEHGFLMYPIAALGVGATPVKAPEKNMTVDVDAMLAAVTDKTTMVFVANPNNPTGTYIPHEEMRRLRQGLPDNVLLVVDAAYAEYVDAGDYDCGTKLVDEFDGNVVMTRTFSKIYGLAALRLGWMYGPENIIDVINRLRNPFNVTTPAHVAGIAALDDQDHIKAAKAHNDQWAPWLIEKLTPLGLTVPKSVGNFLLIDFGDAAKAKEADNFLAHRGLLVRGMAGYGLADTLRLTIGEEEANHALVQAVAEFLNQ